MTDLASSAGQEWAQLLTTAILGTDRRPLPPAGHGWERLASGATDAAIELLDRCAAVATARRAGVEPSPPPPPMCPAPPDLRPVCSPAATRLLARLLGGEHEILLPEWFVLCARGGYRPAAHLVPTLLLRGRRDPAFDAVARRVIGPRAAWLAEALPELGIKAVPKTIPAGAEPFTTSPRVADSGAVVTAIVGSFIERSATWAAVAQMRIVISAIDPAWLPALTLELNRAPFHPLTERTRVDLLGLSRMRTEINVSLPMTTSTL